MLTRLPIRIRLSAAFALLMAIVLLAVGAFVYQRVARSLGDSLNRTLSVRADDIAAAARRSGGDVHDFGGAEGVAQVIAADGRVLRGTPGLDRRSLLTHDQLRLARGGSIRFDAVPAVLGGGRWRLLGRPAASAPNAPVVVVASSLGPREQALGELLGQLLVGGAAALLLAWAGAYVLAAAALRPVEAMSSKAAAISLRGDDQRLPVPTTKDEIAKLGGRLNEMLARIDDAFAHERRFLADASHELRTPLAILRTELDLATRRPRSRAELENVVASAREEVERLGELAEDLLVVARSDQGGLPVDVRRVPAAELLGAIVARFDLQSREQGRRVLADAPTGLELTCDPTRVGQALGNLIDNALRHGAGDVRVVALPRAGLVELHVRDSGGGFPAAFLPRAFERFSRSNEARVRPGGGLGLAIVQAIAQAHGGEVGASNAEEGGADVWLAVAAAR